jgi:hypothetical protein
MQLGLEVETVPVGDRFSSVMPFVEPEVEVCAWKPTFA